MTLKHLLRVLHQYDTMVEVEALRHQGTNSPFADANGQLCHARWMCQEIRDFLPRHKVDEPPPDPKEMQAAMEKAMRWLGFIQGVLWSTGTRSIDEMREDNRASGRQS